MTETWEPAEKVQKNSAGEYRAMIGGEWVPVAKAQKSPAGEFRVMRGASMESTETPQTPPVKRPLPLEIAGPILSGMTTTMRGGLNLITPNSKLGSEIWPPTPDSGAQVMGMLGDPLAWGIAGTVGKALPWVKVGGQGIFDAAKAIGRNFLPGAVTGGAISGLASEGDPLSMVGGAEIGGILSATLPPIANVPINAIRAIRERIYPTSGGLGVKAAGPQTPEVINALLTNRSNVPGVNLTSGQASVPANSAEFAALQNLIATRKAPSQYFGPTGIEGQQAGARVVAVQTIGGTPGQLQSAVAKRTAASDANYEAAFDEVVKRDKELRALWKNPYFKDEVGEAFKLLRAEASKRGEKMPITKNLTQFLQFVKEGMDARLQTLNNPLAPAISKSTKSAIQDAKGKLVGWLEARNPSFETARLEHIRLSKPINQMKVGQDLERALVAPATEAERVGSFGGAVRKAETTVSKATGKPIIEALTPQQRGVLNAIEEDFKRNADYTRLASKGASNLERRIGKTEIPPVFWFDPLVSGIKGWTNRAIGSGHENALARLAPIMADPQKMAASMQAATQQQRQVLQSMISDLVTQGSVIGTSQGIFGHRQPQGILRQE